MGGLKKPGDDLEGVDGNGAVDRKAIEEQQQKVAEEMRRMLMLLFKKIMFLCSRVRNDLGYIQDNLGNFYYSERFCEDLKEIIDEIGLDGEEGELLKEKIDILIQKIISFYGLVLADLGLIDIGAGMTVIKTVEQIGAELGEEGVDHEWIDAIYIAAMAGSGENADLRNESIELLKSVCAYLVQDIERNCEITTKVFEGLDNTLREGQDMLNAALLEIDVEITNLKEAIIDKKDQQYFNFLYYRFNDIKDTIGGYFSVTGVPVVTLGELYGEIGRRVDGYTRVQLAILNAIERGQYDKIPG